MAVIGTDEEEQKKMFPTTSTSPGSRAGFVGGVDPAGKATGAATAGAPTATGGGGYANLSQYLNANQDSGAATGQAGENVVKQSGNDALLAQNAYAKSAGDDITNASKPLDVNQDTLSSIKSGTATVDQGQLQKIKSAGDATTGLYKTPKGSSVNYGGPSYDQTAVSYGGPTAGSWTGQTAANQLDAIQKQGVVTDNVNNAQGGQSGVSALLRQAYKRPDYTVGENSLDAFLAGGTAGGQEALGRVGQTRDLVSGHASDIDAGLGGLVKDAQNKATKTNDLYKKAIEDAQKTSSATQDTYNLAATDAKAATKKAYDDAQAQAAANVDTGGTGGENPPPENPPPENPPPEKKEPFKKIIKEIKKEVDDTGGAIGKGGNDVIKTLDTAGRDTRNFLKKAGGDLSDTTKKAGLDISDEAKRFGGTLSDDDKAIQDYIKRQGNNAVSAWDGIGGFGATPTATPVATAVGNLAKTFTPMGSPITPVVPNGLGQKALDAMKSADLQRIASGREAREKAAAASNKAGGDVASTLKKAGGDLSDTTKKAGADISDAAKDLGGTLSYGGKQAASQAKKILGFANGGRVPSYSKLCAMLGRK